MTIAGSVRCFLRWRSANDAGRNRSAAELCQDCPGLAAQLHAGIQMLRHVSVLAAKEGQVAAAERRDDETIAPRSSVPRHDTASSADDHTDGSPSAQEAAEEFGFLERPQESGELGRLLHYRVLRELGRGGMGCVLLAEDTRLQRQVALKVMLPRYARDAKAKERFLREARSAAKVHHDNVVTIFEVGEHQGVPFLALEYLQGKPLDAFLKQKGKLPLATAVRIAKEIAEGLAAAHQQGLVHRDIKPGNVWLEAPKGRVKILDFGLARAESEDTHLTQSGMIVGTPAFMAPEQARGEKVDGRCDLFSLGVVLYTLATGQSPFAGTTPMAVLTAIAVKIPAPAQTLNPNVPASLEKIMARLLEKDPAQRYASAKALVADLNGVLRELGQLRSDSSKTLAAPELPLPRPEGPRRSTRLPKLIALGAFFFVLVLMAGQIIIRIQNKDGSETRIEVPKDAKVIVEDPNQQVPAAKSSTVKTPTAKTATVALSGIAPGKVHLVAGAHVTGFSGLLPEPPPLPGVKRWNVETRYARGPDHACWSPDGKYVAVVIDRQLRIYEVPGLKLVRILPEHFGGADRVAWSPDGRWLACTDNTVVRIYDAQTGQAGPVLTGPGVRNTSIAWTADSGKLVSCAGSSGVFVWSADGALVRKLPVEPSLFVACNPRDENLAVISGAFNALTFWNLDTGERLPHVHVLNSYQFAWSEDGRSLIVAINDKKGPSVVAVDVTGDGKPRTVRDQGSFSSIRPRTGQFLYTNGIISHLWDSLTKKPGPNFSIYGRDFGFSPDGKWLLSGEKLNNLQLSSVAENSAKAATMCLQPMKRVAWSPKVDVIATDITVGHDNRSVALWDLGKRRYTYIADQAKRGAEFISLTWDPLSERLVSGANSEGVRIWNALPGKVEKSLDDLWTKTKANSGNAAFSPDGKWIAAAAADKVGLWDARTYQLTEMLDLGVKIADPRVAFVGDPPALHVHNRRWNMQKREWEAISESPMLYSPDGILGITRALDWIEIRDVPNGSTKKSEKLPPGLRMSGGWGAAWSADSQHFAAPTDQGPIALYRRDGKLVRLLHGGRVFAWSCAFAPHGAPRLAAVEQLALRVWNTDTGRQLFVGIRLSEDQAAILDDQGDVLTGDPATVERELVYLIEYQDGRTAVLTPAEFRATFRAKTAAAAAPAGK